MRWFYNLSIKTKLISSFVLVALLAGVVGLIGISNIRKIDNADTMLYEKMTMPISYIGDVATAFHRVRVNLRDAVIADNPKDAQAKVDRALMLTREIEKNSKLFEKTIIQERTREAYEEFLETRKAFAPHYKAMRELAVAGKDAEALAVMYGPGMATAKAEQAAIDKLEAIKAADAKKTSDNNTVIANKAVSSMILLVVIAVTLAIGLGLFISKVISNPVTELVGAAERIADGDLTVAVKNEFKDEIGMLAGSFAKMVVNLRDVVGNVQRTAQRVASSSQELSATAEEVTKGSQQISETVAQVASGSQEQSSTVLSGAAAMDQLERSIQEVATGAQTQARGVERAVDMVQQITGAIQQVTALSQEAAANGQQVSEVATSGGKQVAEAVEGMDRIKNATDLVGGMVKKLGESSQQIGAIVETIDDIAEQTNLLALNAAIEAARAGEHGKGFAVVADEVRKLAERSSKATGEIAELINGIQQMTTHAVDAMNKGSQEVAEGAQLANQAGDALGAIQSAVSGIVKQIKQVSDATQNMSTSSIEVIKAIENVSVVTQQTTAATEEMSASSLEVAHRIEQVAAVSQENAAAAEEVSATTEEQTASAEELSSSAEEMAAMAEELQEQVSKFKLEDGSEGYSLRDVTLRTKSGIQRKAA